MILSAPMPRRNGLRSSPRCRRTALARCPPLMLSASAREEDVIWSYRLGANSYIQKPVAFDRFLETLNLLGNYWFAVARLAANARR